MFPRTPSYTSSHYFSNMSYRLSVNQLSISPSYLHLKKLLNTSPPKPLNRLSSYERHIQVPLGCTTIHAIFLLTVRRIRMAFSLKISLSQGESSLKISAQQVKSFRKNKLTHSLTFYCFYTVILSKKLLQARKKLNLHILDDSIHVLKKKLLNT